MAIPAHLQLQIVSAERALVNETVDVAKQKVTDPAYGEWLDRNLHTHRQPGYVSVTVSLKPIGKPPGDISSAQMDAVADLAMMRGTGARGLRAIIEEVLLHVMYDVPSREDIAKVVVTDEVVRDNVNPTLVPRASETKKKKSA